MVSSQIYVHVHTHGSNFLFLSLFTEQTWPHHPANEVACLVIEMLCPHGYEHPLSSSMTFYRFRASFIYGLFIEQYGLILSVGVCIFVNTNCMFFFIYVLNVPVCVSVLVFPSIYSVLVYY